MTQPMPLARFAGLFLLSLGICGLGGTAGRAQPEMILKAIPISFLVSISAQALLSLSLQFSRSRFVLQRPR